MPRYEAKCPRCGEIVRFKASKDIREIDVVCNKCSYVFRVTTSSECISHRASTVAMQIDFLPIKVVEGSLFIILIIGSIFNEQLFLIALLMIVISIFFPPLIVIPSIISFYVIFTKFGLIHVILYMLLIGALVLAWLGLIRYSQSN